MRIGVGLLALAYFLSYGWSPVERWFGPAGMLPIEKQETWLKDLLAISIRHPSPLYLTTSPGLLSGLHFVAIAGAFCLAIGFCTRVANVLSILMVLAYVHRIPEAMGHLEPVLAFMLLYLAVGPAGARLSLDALFWPKRGAEQGVPSVAANLSLRLMQVHVALFYGMMGLSKLHGDAWWEGEGIWMLLAQTESRPVDWSSLRGSPYSVNAWTHLQVYAELAFAVLIWNPRVRPWLVVGTSLLWLMFIQASGLTTFCLAMIVASLAFVPLVWLQVAVGDTDR